MKGFIAGALFFLSLLLLGYAIYRSVAPTITRVEGADQVVYGLPQHGITFGLCFVAGMCILSGVLLLLDQRHRNGNDATRAYSNRTATATNYPQPQ